MPTITMYSTGTCPYCAQAENLFKRKGLTVNKIRIDQNEVEYGNMIAKTGNVLCLKFILMTIMLVDLII